MDKTLEKFLNGLTKYERRMFEAKLDVMCEYYADLYIHIDEVEFEKLIDDMKRLDKYPTF